MSTPASSTGASGRARHRTHHRPVLYSAEKFERHEGGMDPAAREEAAHASARILLMRGRGTDEQMTERLVSFTDDYGIEMLAELWSHASAHSLPGALWRMYWLRDTVHRSPRGVSRAFELGMAEDYRSHVVAGVPDPPGADEVVRTIDEILAGLYTGDMDIAMERCAAFAHVVALGIRADYARSAGQDGAVPGSHEVKREAVERRARLPRQAQQMEQIAHDLEAVAAQLRAVEAGQQVNGGSGLILCRKNRRPTSKHSSLLRRLAAQKCGFVPRIGTGSTLGRTGVKSLFPIDSAPGAGG